MSGMEGRLLSSVDCQGESFELSLVLVPQLSRIAPLVTVQRNGES